MEGRSSTTIKNFWNSYKGKKLSKKDPQVFPMNPDGIGFGPESIPNASSIPAPVLASLEPFKADQVVEIVEDTPVDQYSDLFVQELLRDQDSSDRFMENIVITSPDADGPQNITTVPRKLTVKRARWSEDEDHKLFDYIKRKGEPSSWKNVPRDAGLSWRKWKGCKLRWNTKLSKHINTNPLSKEEKETIIQLHKQHGNKWEDIAKKMEGRSSTTIKNFWNSYKRKKLSKRDPQVFPRNPDGIGFGLASIPNASSIPVPVLASLEPSKADQVVEIFEVSLADQEIANRYSSTSTTFDSEDIPFASIFSDRFRPEDISIDSIFN